MTYTQPLLLVFLAIALLGLARLRRCPGVWLPALAVVAVFLTAWPVAAWICSRPLEGRYPIRPFSTDLNYGAIVVLASAVSPPQYERPYPLLDEDGFHRCRFSSWLYAKHPEPVLVSGGRDKPNDQPYSLSMRDVMLQMGIPASMIWTEQHSYSTHTNATYSTEILRSHAIARILLVVDAASMPRASACFRKLGIDVIPAPSDWYQPENMLMPTWKAVRQNELVLHEILGLGWYRIKGWI